MRDADLLEIHRRAVDAGLAEPSTRELLIPDPGLRAQISTGRNASEQLLHDLMDLRGRHASETGRCCLVEWLERAAELLHPRPEGREFVDWAARARASSTATSAPLVEARAGASSIRSFALAALAVASMGFAAGRLVGP